MTEVYMVRHCEAMGNVLHLFQGTSDFDISELGAEQLKYLKKRFDDIKLDKVYSSPLTRALKTASAIIGNRNIKPIEHSGLIEIGGGILEGKPFAEGLRQFKGLAEIWEERPHDFAPQDGEAMRDAYDRIWNTVLEIAKENKGKTIACATHGGVLRCLTCRILIDDITKLKDIFWYENTAVTLIRFNDDFKPEFIFMNDISHLPEELINKKSRLASITKEENQ